MENSKKGYWLLALVVIVIVVALYLALKEEAGAPDGDLTGDDPVMCTQDAMRCPDGSYVSRIPPTCEFAACGESITPNVTVPEDWEK